MGKVRVCGRMVLFKCVSTCDEWASERLYWITMQSAMDMLYVCISTFPLIEFSHYTSATAAASHFDSSNGIRVIFVCVFIFDVQIRMSTTYRNERGCKNLFLWLAFSHVAMRLSEALTFFCSLFWSVRFFLLLLLFQLQFCDHFIRSMSSTPCCAWMNLFGMVCKWLYGMHVSEKSFFLFPLIWLRGNRYSRNIL